MTGGSSEFLPITKIRIAKTHEYHITLKFLGGQPGGDRVNQGEEPDPPWLEYGLGIPAVERSQIRVSCLPIFCLFTILHFLV